MNVTRMDVLMYGFVITRLFDGLYPSGTTLAQMEADAADHGWITAILPSLSARKQMDSFVDVSEVGF